GDKRKQPRNPDLECALQRPDDGDDEQRERDRRKNRAREVKAGKDQNRGAEAQHGQCASAGHAALVPWNSYRRWTFMLDADEYKTSRKSQRPSRARSPRRAR